ncbi:MAG: heparinase II/III family protein [Caldilineaceae bacterium]|nr:heparinase II/III family protein [Caldilineaceae bacterium]
MFSQRFSEQLSGHLQPQQAFRPLPKLTDRAGWEGLPASVRRAHIGRAEEALGYAWPALPATLYLEYSRIGNRSNFEAPHFARRQMLATLVLAECMEAQGRFLDDIVNGIWAICEESSWCIPAHIRHQRAGNTMPDTAEPIVDLFAAETGALLAWTVYLLGERLDGVSPMVLPRIEREIRARILEPALACDDFHWMGFVNDRGRRVNNWNPWICSNWLASVLIMQKDDAQRVAAVTKIMRALDNFIDPYPRDGGCDEGPNYWGRAGASLFDNLELLYAATGGWIDVYDEPLVREIGRFIYRVHIAGDYYLNFADASAIVQPEALLVYRYGRRIEDAAMVSFGRWLAERRQMMETGILQGTGRVPPSLGRALPDLFVLADAFAQPGHAPLLRDVWLGEIEVMVARDQDGSSDGFYLAAKGGTNGESHNHNDIGDFVVYVDGKPLIVDAGVETYSAKTFGPNRYDIWTMQSAYHSLLPTVDGAQQLPGPQFAAREVGYAADDRRAALTLEIAAAYPPQAKIGSWQRTVALSRGEGVEVCDRYQLTGPAQTVTLSLLSPCRVVTDTPGRVEFHAAAFADDRMAGEGIFTYDAGQFRVTTETVPITDARMGPVWGDHLTRVILTAENPAQQGEWSFGVRRL